MANGSRALGTGGNTVAHNFPGSDVFVQTGATAAVVYRRPAGATVLTMTLSSGGAAHYVDLSDCAFPGTATFSSGDAATDTVTMAAPHGFVTGDGPYQLTEVGTLPAGLAVATDYWVYVVSTTEVKFCTSYDNAVRTLKSSMDGEIDAPVVIDLTTNGAGANTVVSAFPARLTANGSSTVSSMVAGFEKLPVSFAAPDTFTAQLSNAGARLEFWWS